MKIVASSRVSVKAAAMAEGQEDSQRVRLERLALTLKTVYRFKSAARGMYRVRTGSVTQTREELRRLYHDSPNGDLRHPRKLKRRQTLLETNMPSIWQSPIYGLWLRLKRLPCFRGFIGFLYLAVPQWYLSQVIDFLLSGQPAGMKPGYGTTGIVLATAFAEGYAVWTHYCITKPHNKDIFDHFPKGREVLLELWPTAAFGMLCEHLPSSLSLALSRHFELRKYAYDAKMWSTLNAEEQSYKVLQFVSVLFTYALFVAVFSIPATMIVKRVYASMLSDEDLAIVPFRRGTKSKTSSLDHRSEIHRPGLPPSEAWATIDRWQYLRVLGIYLQYFAVNQIIQIAYWIINWKLQELLGVDKFPDAKLPSPIKNLIPLKTRSFVHSEL